MKLRPNSALLGLLLATIAAGIPAAALEAGKAGAETTTSLRGTIALTGGTCLCPTDSTQVYLFHLASGKLSQLTQGLTQHVAVGWSPDGSRLLVGETGPGHGGLYALRADGRSQILLAKRADWSEAQWSPDGRRVAYLGPPSATASGTFTARHLYVVNADGKHRLLLARRVLVGNGLEFHSDSGDFSWAPSGRKIVFFGNCNKPLFACSEVDSLITVKTTGNRTMQQIAWATRFLGLAHRFSVAPRPSWSPDGSRIAFLSAEPYRAGLVVARTNGSHLKVLPVPGMLPRLSSYAWSPNSSWIAGYADSADMVMRTDGTKQRSWSASMSGITFSPNSAMLAYVGGPANAPNGALYVTNADGSKTIQVLNAPSLYFDRPLWRGGTAETETW